MRDEVILAQLWTPWKNEVKKLNFMKKDRKFRQEAKGEFGGRTQA